MFPAHHKPLQNNQCNKKCNQSTIVTSLDCNMVLSCSCLVFRLPKQTLSSRNRFGSSSAKMLPDWSETVNHPAA